MKSTTIEVQKKYFKAYSYLPIILAGITLLLFFIWGIIDPIVFNYSSGHDLGPYGIMQLNSGFLCWFVWMIIGAVMAALEYIIGKIAFSQKILTVLYLQSIDEKLSNKQDEQNENIAQ
jgi:hypothetical protein